MAAYHLSDDFIDPAAERACLAALARDPAAYWPLADTLSPEAFAAERDLFHTVVAAIRADRPPLVPDTWEPADDLAACCDRLTDLRQRREVATLIEQQMPALNDPTRPAQEVLAAFADEVMRLRASMSITPGTALEWGHDLLAAVLRDAEARHAQRIATGQPVMGVPTGLKKLDTLLNGLNPGLHLLAGAPGVGKTTLCAQFAEQAARTGVPVLYVTYENAPVNLMQKLLAARAGVNPLDIQRGWADLAALHRAAAEWGETASRLAVIAGTSRLELAEVRARARQACKQHGAAQCLLVFDYIQIAAHGQGYEQLRHNVAALAEGLRELAVELASPVLAISSMNRASGYGKDGTAGLEALKESGDLEYGADVVLFLLESKERQAVAPARAVDLAALKNRSGDVGSVPLIFRPDCGTLREEAYQ